MSRSVNSGNVAQSQWSDIAVPESGFPNLSMTSEFVDMFKAWTDVALLGLLPSSVNGRGFGLLRNEPILSGADIAGAVRDSACFGEDISPLERHVH